VDLEIVKGIHLIPRIRGANSYLIQVDEGITVVDTGMPGNTSKILEYVESIGRHSSDVKTIVLTHSDIDHVGSTAKLKDATRAEVAIHEADAPRLSGEKELKKVNGAMGLVLRVIGSFIRFQRLKADTLLKDSDVISGLIVIHTPGHTDGSICLYLPGRALFVGDALATDPKRTLSLPRKATCADFKLAKESLRKIAPLEYSVLLPGHGPPIEQNASKATREFVARF